MNKLKFFGVLIFAVSVLNLEVTAQRPRVIVKDLPTPTPTVSPTPPAATPESTPTPVPVQTLPFLQARIQASLFRSEARRGHIGVKVISLDSGKTIFEQNSEKYFVPASNMKVLTVAAALEKLSPNFRFKTSVYAQAPPDENGVIKGDLTIFGRGDVSISTSFSNGDYYKGLDELAEKIARAGVKRIEGNLVGDTSYFSGNAIPKSWEWDDLQWYYGAEISALSINDNAIDFSVRPGSSNGAACVAQVEPLNSIFKIINRCTTANGSRTLKVTKLLGQNVIEISGTMSRNDRGFRGYIAVSNPAELFIEFLRQRLLQKGVVITGRNRINNEKAFFTSQSVELAKLESPPLSIIAQKILKPSQNLYTESLLWALGEEAGGTNSDLTSQQKGVAVVKRFLQETGAPSDSLIQWDGSGLSRHNLVTPDAIVKVYEHMAKSRSSLAFGSALTIGGVDGTLKNRFRGTSAEANVRGKTGTLDQVSSLSGYVNSASGERFVFSVIVNGVNSVGARKRIIDDIVVALANFNGRTD